MNFLTCAHISVIVCLTGAGLMTGRLDEAEEGGLGLKGADGVIAEEVEWRLKVSIFSIWKMNIDPRNRNSALKSACSNQKRMLSSLVFIRNNWQENELISD